jgi:paraquat-inducible protein A
MPDSLQSMVVCEHCGQPHRWVRLAPRSVARCSRCDAVLGRGHRMDVSSLLALTLAAAIVFCIAHGSNIITINLAGTEVRTTYPMALSAAWESGEHGVAVLSAVTALLAPAVFIGLRLYLLVPLMLGRVPVGFATCLRLLFQASRWNTVEVLTVAALLSLVRIAALAQASPGPGLVAFGVLALLLAALESAGLRHLWWHVP